jgi:AraC-like DNA-binding protein
MMNTEAWSAFAERQGQAAPLSFVYSSRHEVLTSYYCKPHSHRSIEIVYHPSGRGVTRLKSNTEFQFREHSAVIYAPREMHDQEMSVTGEDMCLHLAVPANAPVPESGLHIPHVDDPLLIEEICALSQRGQNAGADHSVSDFRATAVLLALTHLACTDDERKRAHPDERRILTAEEFIRENSATIASMREVAEHVGISYDFLRHTFRRLRGKSLVRFFNEVRIDRVKTMLAHSKQSLKEIAPACGFTDEYYLSTVFRKMTGMTPGHYRKNHV